MFFFCCLGGGVFFFLLFGPGASFFLFAVWAGDGSSLTYPSAWLVFKRPNNKRDRTAKKKTRVPYNHIIEVGERTIRGKETLALFCLEALHCCHFVVDGL